MTNPATVAIYDSVLEDTTLTDAECRLLLYLAAQPEGWEIHAGQVAAALNRTQPEVDTAIRGLRSKGYITGQVLAYDRVVATP